MRWLANLILHLPGMKERLLLAEQAASWSLMTDCVFCHVLIAKNSKHCPECGVLQSDDNWPLLSHGHSAQMTDKIVMSPRLTRVLKPLEPETQLLPNAPTGARARQYYHGLKRAGKV